MATHIVQTEIGGRAGIVLQVTGEMLRDDAALLERITSDAQDNAGGPVTIDLADLSFIDSDAAPILRRLSERPGVRIDGIEIFLQAVINDVEKR